MTDDPAELQRQLQEAYEMNARLTEELSGLHRQLRRAGQAETQARNELNRVREEEPDSPVLQRLMRLWRDLYRDGDMRVKITLDSDRAKLLKRRVKQYDPEFIENAIRGAEHDDWAMGRHPKLRTSGSKFNDIKHILKDEETIERLAELHRNGGDQGTGGRSRPSSPPSGTTGLALLHERFPDAKKSGEQWATNCPAHEDRTASLTFGQGTKGAVVKCFAGCSAEDIAKALGFDLGDLFDPEDAPVRQMPKPQKPRLPTDEELAFMAAHLLQPRVADAVERLRGWTKPTLERLGLGYDSRRKRIVIPIRDGAGELVSVLRYQPNPDRRSDTNAKMIAATGGGRHLFPAPETIPGDEIWLVEGEPDAISAMELGLPAVAVPGTGGWKPGFASRLARARVYICFDCDIKGRLAADRVARDLVGVAGEVRLVDLDPGREDGWDLSDLLMEGGSAAVVHDLARIGGSVVSIGSVAA